MKLFARNIENELLYIKNFTPPAFEQAFKSIDELLYNPIFRLERYTDTVSMVGNELIKDGNSIASAYSVLRLASKNKNYFHKLFSEVPARYANNRSFRSSEKELATAHFNEIAKFGGVTISPNDPSASQAIHGINDTDEFSHSWDIMSNLFRAISVENSQAGDCFKIYILRGKVVAIYGVVPAFIVGDGVSSVSRLIESQNLSRSRNVFYESRTLGNINRGIDKNRTLENNEILRLKSTCDLGKGAILIDLSSQLLARYEVFVEALNNILIDAAYIELTCYSDNFFAGPANPGFFVRDVKFHTADLRELFACATTQERTESYLDALRTGEPKTETIGELVKSPVFENEYLRSATQVSILKEAAYRMGLIIEMLDREFMTLTHPATEKRVRFLAGMSSKTVSLARDASNNKYLTKQLLDRVGIHTPKGFRFDIDKKEEAWATAKTFNASVVVKPLDGSGGVGVTTDITAKQDFDNAWRICEDLGTKIVLVEENVAGNDYRVIVIGNKVCAVTQRTAAYVEGDGEHTIKQLIDIKAEQRLDNPFYRIKHFQENEVMVNFLKKQSKTLEYIPKSGEYVQLLNAVNIGSGGESIDRTDEIHADWISIAVRARKAILNAYHVGLDFMAEDISRSPSRQKWSIIEVNTNPELGLQIFPGSGHARDVGVTLISELVAESLPSRIGYRLKIRGRVQGVGFRKWFQSVCNLRSVVGYIKNMESPSVVEAEIYGPEATLDEIFRLSYDGPKRAVVRSIVIEPASLDEIGSFARLEVL